MKLSYQIKASQPLQFAAAVLVMLSPALRANVIPSPLFTDNAVLQRDVEVPVWGMADAGERVTVSFGGQTREVTADEQ
ncbi:MAG: acetyl esterase, partial [Verrucomicrobiota bacterium]